MFVNGVSPTNASIKTHETREGKEIRQFNITTTTITLSLRLSPKVR